jgi:hypothetical protein
MAPQYFNVEIFSGGKWSEFLHWKALSTCQREARRLKDAGAEVRIRVAKDNHLVDYVSSPKRYYPRHLYDTPAERLEAEVRAVGACVPIADIIEPMRMALNNKMEKENDERSSTDLPPFM